MVDFYKVHAKAIEYAFNRLTRESGDIFRVILKEPILPFKLGGPPPGPTLTAVEFVRLGGGSYEPTNSARAAIRLWCERHKDTPESSFQLPDDLPRPRVRRKARLRKLAPHVPDDARPGDAVLFCGGIFRVRESGGGLYLAEAPGEVLMERGQRLYGVPR